jgi:adenylate cyclase
MAAEPGRRGRRITIRWSLIRNVVFLMALLTGSILLGTAWVQDEIARATSRALIGRALHRAEADLRRFFDPVQRSLLLSRALMENGTLDVDDARGLNRIFVPLIERIPQISSINVGDASGHSYLLLRLEDRWRNRITRIDEWGDRLEYTEWRDEDAVQREWVVEEPGEDERYDPRTRAWYVEALELDASSGGDMPVGWTDPYTFFSTGEPGITATLPVEDAAGRRFVLAFDVLLRDLSSFTRALDVSANGFGAVLDEDGGVVGLPRAARFDDPVARRAALLRRPIDLGIPVLEDAARSYRSYLSAPPPVFSFESGGTTWWADVRPFPLGANRTFTALVIVPERDLLGPLERFRMGLVAVALASFAIAVVMALLLARSYARPLAALAKNSQRIGALDLEPGEPVESQLHEVEQLVAEQERTRVALDSFARYVPVDVIRELMVRGEAARIGGSRRQVTALFTDIQGFTSVAESMAPEALTAHLGEYFEAMLGIVQGDGFGTVTQLTGDGLVGFWGAPVPDAEHSRHAVAAVVACRERLAELDAAWLRRGLPALPTRFGLAAGPVVVGNVGAPSRLVYTAVGDTLNLASRLEGLSRFYGTSVLAASEVRNGAGDGYAWRLVDVVRVKGKSKAVEVYELLGLADRVPPERLAFAKRYESALHLHRERRFAEAVALLEQLARERPGDASVERLAARARLYADEPPDPDWDGVVDYFEK